MCIMRDLHVHSNANLLSKKKKSQCSIMCEVFGQHVYVGCCYMDMFCSGC